MLRGFPFVQRMDAFNICKRLKPKMSHIFRIKNYNLTEKTFHSNWISASKTLCLGHTETSVFWVSLMDTSFMALLDLYFISMNYKYYNNVIDGTT